MPTLFDIEAQQQLHARGPNFGRPQRTPTRNDAIPPSLQPYLMAAYSALAGAAYTWGKGSPLSPPRVEKSTDSLVTPKKPEKKSKKRERPASNSKSNSKSDSKDAHSSKMAKHSNKKSKKSNKKSKRSKSRKTSRKRKQHAPVVRKNATGYGGRFKKVRLRSVGTDPGMVYGSRRKFETGGKSTHAKAFYVGHSTQMPHQEHRAVWESIVRYCLRKCRIEIQSFADEYLMSMDVFYYRRTDDSIAGRQVVTNNADNTNTGTETLGTVAAMADNMARAFYDTLKTNIDTDFYIDSFTFRVNFGQQSVCSFKPSQSQISLWKKSTLRVQNQSKAGDTTTTIPVANEIANNPLVGKMYNSNASGFLPLIRPTAINAQYKGFSPNGVGAIGVVDAGEDLSHLVKPPHARFFRNTTAAGTVYLAPGQLKSHVLVKSYTTSLSRWFMSQRRIIVEHGNLMLTNPSLRSLGYNDKATLFGLEKQLDTRGEANSIDMGWQLETKVSVGLKVRDYQSIPEFVDDTAATVGNTAA